MYSEGFKILQKKFAKMGLEIQVTTIDLMLFADD